MNEKKKTVFELGWNSNVIQWDFDTFDYNQNIYNVIRYFRCFSFRLFFSLKFALIKVHTQLIEWFSFYGQCRFYSVSLNFVGIIFIIVLLFKLFAFFFVINNKVYNDSQYDSQHINEENSIGIFFQKKKRDNNTHDICIRYVLLESLQHR